LKGPEHRLFVIDSNRRTGVFSLLLAGRPKKGNSRVFTAFLGFGKFPVLLPFVFFQCLLVFLSGSRLSVLSDVLLLFLEEGARIAVQCIAVSEKGRRERE
jgi:hypothetical protein